MIQVNEINAQLNHLSQLIRLGQFDDALFGVKELQQIVEEISEQEDVYLASIANLASLFIDIGMMMPCIDAAKVGFDILNDNKEQVIGYIGDDNYYYNLSNAKSALIEEPDPFKNSFSTIEKLVSIKTDLWRAIRFQHNNSENVEPTFLVNLGNSLKRQFRVVEALECYDQVTLLDLDIPQAWLNRSETLLMLNEISNTGSIQMLTQIKKGYN